MPNINKEFRHNIFILKNFNLQTFRGKKNFTFILDF